MRQKTARHFPFAALGLVLMAVSVAPTVIGMVRGFAQMQRGEDATAVTSSVALASHPAFIACRVAGLVLVIVGIVLAIRRAGRPVA
jgi:hypothetical protein